PVECGPLPDESNGELGLTAGARARCLAERGGRRVRPEAREVDGVRHVEQLRDQLRAPIAADAHALAGAQIEARVARAVDRRDRRQAERCAPRIDESDVQVAIPLIARAAWREVGDE